MTVLKSELTNGKAYKANKRARKIARRLAIYGKLTSAYKAIYHNATLGSWILPKDAKKFFNEEEQWEEIQFHFNIILQSINDETFDREYIEGRITEYGEVNTYGRGGKTCAPTGFIKDGGNHFCNAIDITELGNLPMRQLRQLLTDITEWNEYVKLECSSENLQFLLTEKYNELKEEYVDEMRDYARLLTI